MAILALKVPYEVGRLLNTIEVPGEKVPLHEYHVTLLYLGKEVPLPTLGKIVVAVAQVAESFRPFTCSLDHITNFPEGDDGFPTICPVSSEGVHILNEELKEALDEHEVEYSKKFPEFNPHVTLSYAPDEMERKDFRHALDWTCYEMTLWGGDHGDERLATTYPFAMMKGMVASANLVKMAREATAPR